MNQRFLLLVTLLVAAQAKKEDEVLSDLAAGAAAGLIQDAADNCFSDPICEKGGCVCTKVFGGLFLAVFLGCVVTIFTFLGALCTGQIKLSELIPTIDDVWRAVIIWVGYSVTRRSSSK